MLDKYNAVTFINFSSLHLKIHLLVKFWLNLLI